MNGLVALSGRRRDLTLLLRRRALQQFLLAQHHLVVGAVRERRDHRSADLVKQLKNLQERESELRSLMAKASEGGGAQAWRPKW